ncbi:aldo/keto reductase [Streptomyces lavendulocolor]|uniref:aldo/keto reductase n=1 Tax=Streptomyces lavendulocolor TaxID=67316 RepID=UPI0033C5A8CD
MNEHYSTGLRTGDGTGKSALYRRLGQSGLLVSAVSLRLSCDQGINEPQPSQQLALVERALDQGVNHFDLMMPPNRLHNHLNLHQSVLSALYEHREDVVVSAQVGFHPLGRLAGFGSSKHITSALDGILRQTGLEYLDILYLNRYDRITPMRETVKAMTTAVDRGKTLYVGLSDYAPASALRIAKALSELGNPAIACQAPFSLLNPWAQDALTPIMEKQGASLVAETSLPKHLISYATADCRGGSVHDAVQLNGRRREAMKQLEGIAVRRGQSLISLAVSWVLRDWRVASSLLPISSVALFDESLTAMSHLDFTADELSAIDSCREQIDTIFD